jgi:hypothetical protein
MDTFVDASVADANLVFSLVLFEDHLVDLVGSFATKTTPFVSESLIHLGVSSLFRNACIYPTSGNPSIDSFCSRFCLRN